MTTAEDRRQPDPDGDPAFVTDADQWRWQVRSSYLLLDLIHRAQRELLPPVTWTIAPAGASLLIRCATRSEWGAWVKATGVTNVWPERAHGGHSHLHATGRVAAADGAAVRVAVIADIDHLVEAENSDSAPQPPLPSPDS